MDRHVRVNIKHRIRTLSSLRLQAIGDRRANAQRPPTQIAPVARHVSDCDERMMLADARHLLCFRMLPSRGPSAHRQIAPGK